MQNGHQSKNGTKPNLNKPSQQPGSESETLEILQTLGATCRDCPDRTGLGMYAKLLSDIPATALKTAIARHLTESENRWFPAVGTLRRLAVESQAGLIPDWEWAWNEILKALRVWNQFDKEACLKARGMLGDELMGLVSGMGGFYSLANSDNLEVMRSNFRNSWTEKKQRAETLRKTPDAIRPKVGLPSQVSARLESFGSLDRKKLEGGKRDESN